MNNFQFANPAYLLFLLALPALQFIVSRMQNNARERLLRFLEEPNLRLLLNERGRGGGNRKRLLFWLGLAVLIVAFARPQANPVVEEMAGASLDIYVLMDVSRSMDAEDVPPSRLKKAKRSVQTLTRLLAGDRVGVIAFAGTAVVISPLTADYEIVNTFLQNVDTSLIQNQGTDISGALLMAESAMKRGAEKTGNGGARTNVFIVMSDGEDQKPGDFSVVDRIKSEGGIVFTIAFGTEDGASIPVRSERGELSGYKRDRQGNQVKTKVQINSLREVAQRGNGQFYFSTLGEEEIPDIISRVQGMDRNSAALLKARVYQELFWPVLAFGLLLLLFSYFSLRQLLRLPASLPHLPWRKTSAIALCLIPSLAEASPLSFLWNQDKRAFETSQDLAKQGKPDEAAAGLKELLAENPDSPELNYNIGTFLLEGKKGDEARQQLGRLVQKENPLRERGLFNIAGSYAAEGKKNEARAAYAELLSLLQNRGPLSPAQEELRELARKNLARLADEQNQNKPSESQSQDQKQSQGGEGQKPPENQPNPKPSPGQSGKEQKDPKNQDEGKDEKQQKPKDPKDDQGKEQDSGDKKEQKQEQPQEGEQEKGDGQNPKKEQTPPPGMRKSPAAFRERDDMGEDDAKRILEALKQREMGLQKKFLQKKDEQDKFSDHGNDW